MAEHYIERPALCVGPCRPQHDDGAGGPRRTMPGSALCEVCAEKLGDHLTQIADDWGPLSLRVAASDATGVGLGKVEGNASLLQPGIALNDHVVTLRQDVSGWAYFLARALIDERDVTVPANQSTPALLRWLATWHIGWLTDHPDADFIAGITEEARDYKRRVNKAAFPSGARRIYLRQVPCITDIEVVEDAWVDQTGQQHERTRQQRCTGHMYAVISDKRRLDESELYCTEDDAHRMQPEQWRRHAHKRAMDPDAAKRLAIAIAAG